MNRKAFLLLTVLVAILFAACEKNNSASSPSLTNLSGPVSASKTSSISRGEPVVFSFNGSGDSVQWTVTPSDSVTIKSGGDSASIIFNNSGSYTVKGQSGDSSGMVIVTVDSNLYDSTYKSALPTLDSLTGDQINISVSSFDSNSVQGLRFTVTTVNSYNCQNDALVYSLDLSSGEMMINFLGVYEYSGNSCTPGSGPLQSNFMEAPIPNGTYTFVVALNNQAYTGSFVKNGDSYTFTWPYTSGVTISPLTLN